MPWSQKRVLRVSKPTRKEVVADLDAVLACCAQCALLHKDPDI
jgi:hypothetical protein